MARGPCSWLSLSCPNGHTFTACESVRPQKGEREGDRAWLTVIDLGWGRGGNGLGSLRLIFLTQLGKRTLSSAALDLPLWSSFIACQSESVRPQKGKKEGGRAWLSTTDFFLTQDDRRTLSLTDLAWVTLLFIIHIMEVCRTSNGRGAVKVTELDSLLISFCALDCPLSSSFIACWSVRPRMGDEVWGRLQGLAHYHWFLFDSTWQGDLILDWPLWSSFVACWSVRHQKEEEEGERASLTRIDFFLIHHGRRTLSLSL